MEQVGPSQLSPIICTIKYGYSYQRYYNGLSQSFDSWISETPSKGSLTISFSVALRELREPTAVPMWNIARPRREFTASVQETDTSSLCDWEEVNKPTEDLGLLILLSTSKLEAT